MEKGKESTLLKDEDSPISTPSTMNPKSVPPTSTPRRPPAKANKEEEEADDDDDDNDDADGDSDPELDDLDDMLDEFSAVKIDKDAPSASGPGRPMIGLGAGDELPPSATMDVEEDFVRKLQEGMDDLMKELDQSPELVKQMEALIQGIPGTGDVEQAGAAAAGMVVGSSSLSSGGPEGGGGGGVLAGFGGGGAQGAGAAVGSSSSKEKKGEEESFQDTIRKTMERMQLSGDSATAAAADAGESDILAQLLKEMEGMAAEGVGDDDLSKMFLNMMEQLTNKEMLYEPMKELHAKFPGWIVENKGKVPEDKMKSYEEQAVIVEEIVTKFEQPAYTDEKPEDRQYIWERMQKMQAAGSPPEDLISNPLGEGIPQLGEDGMPGCPQQ